MRHRGEWETILQAQMLDDPMPLETFEMAAELYRLGVTAGYTISSSYDRLIAACAIRNRLQLLQRDLDFETIAEIAPLKLFRNV